MTAWEEHQARERGRLLADLRWHWGEAYRFGWDGIAFTAERADNGTMLRSPDAETLRDKVRQDYAAQPVGRPTRPGEGVTQHGVEVRIRGVWRLAPELSPPMSTIFSLSLA